MDFVHGGLLALGELLRVSGPFIQTKFLDCCDKILKYKVAFQSSFIKTQSFINCLIRIIEIDSLEEL